MLNIIIPTFNHPELLREALVSLTLQNYKLFITTIVDDCSTEDLSPVINAFRNHLQINYIRHEENKGQGLARQTGIDWSIQNNIDYVMFMDEDDLLLPNAVQDLYKVAKAQFAQMVYSPIITEDLRTHEDGIIENGKNWVWTHGKCYNVAFLKNNNIRFSDKARYNEDGAFNYLAKNYAKEIIYASQACYRWRDNPASITREKGHIFNKIVYRDVVTGYVDAVTQLLKDEALKEGVDSVVLIYNHYQNLLCENEKYHSISEEQLITINNKINSILGNKKVIDDFKKKTAPRKILNQIDAGSIGIKGEEPLCMYHQNFFEWLLSFNNGAAIVEVLSNVNNDD